MGAAVGCGLRWLASEVDAAIADVRSLARGTYPYVLTDYGLAAALAVAADAAPVSTTVVAEPRRRYAAGDREAMYFCCLEGCRTPQSTQALPRRSASPWMSAMTASVSKCTTGSGVRPRRCAGRRNRVSAPVSAPPSRSAPHTRQIANLTSVVASDGPESLRPEVAWAGCTINHMEASSGHRGVGL